MTRCCVPSCSEIGSHTFPKDEKLHRLWLKAICRKGFVPTKFSRLCRKHFTEDDYQVVSAYTGVVNQHKYLKKNVVPTLFAWNTKPISKQFKLKAKLRKRSPIKKEVSKKNESPLESNENHAKENQPIENKKLRDRSVRLRNRKAFLANRKCSVPQCNTRPSNEVSLHQCPNNAAVRDEWAEALKVSRQCIKNLVACSLHFAKTDFVQSKSAGSRVLKPNAVPSRNLPQRKRVVVPVKEKPPKKTFKPSDRPKTMSDQGDGDPDVQEENLQECRACLKKLDDKTSTCNVFQAWSLSWTGMEATIAEDLAKLANVEISVTDRHSKVICSPCYQSLLSAAKFAANVRSCDLLLRQRFTDEIDMERVWPKPIQVDKNLNGSVFTNTLDVEIKQEVLSDEELTDAFNASGAENAYVETELSNLDIKIEPEEMVEPPPMNITINGTISLNPLNSEAKALTNGTDIYHDNQLLEVAVKQEPISEEEELEQGVPLECLLCTKSFKSVSGLKAHVIAQHSYKSVKRKSDGSVSPMKKCIDIYQCMICRRSFKTPTDLMVHETCHNKHSCYGCTKKFDSFEQLTRHRKLCRAFTKAMPRVRTLEDVKRSLPEPQPLIEEEETLVVEIENRIEIPIEADSEMKDATSDSIQGAEPKQDDETLLVEIKEEVDSNMKLHLEIHSAESEKEKEMADTDMQVETLTNDDS
ncbi:uncharacterized protein LOC113492935 isoform X3 [Trichoplusia ni]|uniref:Uncharacterized protein LOC113492935 isoform X3 n=1 Tax=Trichoplusia ni TaxID=7111 RepID=A0A7E5VDZ8_TRINI|nr:uncharacterized protein LOC113492935 isoform X3 [Trichoplusia ni]